ncbi:hypothetical protein [Silvibacterium dinghuense]|uniref:C-type cytochrome biogenesis protein CcmI n=1 Tax=Silvibacterium dinghuense TaxID=1560006 RepID=A0A4Q1SEQ2_9BACT|nr:hypothetical protein [Silvibacterium dinghuense]RXS95585.1 hypothetical protein ESZ00_13560 [Silvibacterium dinghuense]GGH14220.1 hypothetical protein GCM10011586_34540 [Silvibacterium dinghuense]
MILLACGLLLAGVLGYVFYPERNVAAQRQKTRLEYLRERKDVLYENLRDLNFEYRSGKFVEEDYAAQQAVLENEAAEVIAEMEVLEAQAR